MFKLLISLLFLFNTQEETPRHPSLQVCRQVVVVCECYSSKAGEICTMKVVTECD